MSTWRVGTKTRRKKSIGDSLLPLLTAQQAQPFLGDSTDSWLGFPSDRGHSQRR